MVNIGSISGYGHNTPDNPKALRGKKPSPEDPKQQPSQTTDAVPIIDTLMHVREISEVIHRLQGEIHGAEDASRRQKLETELSSQQVALENALSLSVRNFDPQAALEVLNAQWRTTYPVSRPDAINHLLEDPGS